MDKAAPGQLEFAADFAANFTGERVVPGKVDEDLWNEHVSRYHFAARLCRHQTVIDLGCGLGYGSAILAGVAAQVTGVGIAAEAIAEADGGYRRDNLKFEVASVSSLPFADGDFEAGVCFEVIEHLEDYRSMLREARRVIAPGGQLIVSTPNELYYAESRRASGPNPFHAREFTFEAFRDALAEYFPHQTFFLQNQSSAIAFAPLAREFSVETRIEADSRDPAEANFFIAVCAARPLSGAPAYVFVPRAANVLGERERHIARLERELRTKNDWLERSKAELAALVEKHRALTAELELKNQWALEQNERVNQAHAAVQRIEAELFAQNEAAQKLAQDYESRLGALEADYASYVKWAQENESGLSEQIERLSSHIAKLDGEQLEAVQKVQFFQSKIEEVEKTVVERTLWAQSLDTQRSILEQRLAAMESSRWMKVGRAVGLGPKR
jgi:2-polyprenyl-3-methyl-5-hydroxy-6-metoxy-1,4-benzoquinol methylase